MDNSQIEKALIRLYDEEDYRIVFWNDPDHEFTLTLPLLTLPEGVNIIKLDEVGAFEAKVKLELEDPEGRYLIFSPTEEPDYEDDWLLDIRLYSKCFRADRASIILDELGLSNQHLRDHLSTRRKFFDNKQRMQKLKPMVLPDDNEFDLDRKMIAVVTKADHDEWFNIIRTIFHGYNDLDDVDIDSPPDCWLEIEKYELDEPFWEMAKSVFGYSEETPSLRNFLTRLMVTDFAQHLKASVPDSLTHLVLPQYGKNNAVVCLAQWRDSSTKGTSYDRLSGIIGDLINLNDLFYHFEIYDLLDVATFQSVERYIAQGLRDIVLSNPNDINLEKINEIKTNRQAGYWATTGVPGNKYAPREGMHSVYEAIAISAEFFSLKNKYPSGFSFSSSADMYNAYTKEIFSFDQLYRRFCEQADIAALNNWDVLKKLRTEVEACYVNWYLHNLADAWGKYLDPKGSDSLLSSWKIYNVDNQEQFFYNNIAPKLKEAERRRSFVIISDALRYEVAEELNSELNGKYRFESDLTSMLGALPSYTSLGMACLLPHDKLEYNVKGDLLVDGQNCSSMEQRDQILAKHEGMAVKAEDLLKMSKDQGRDLIKDKRLVYIYHNAIDKIGDSAGTESQTFQAARQAINELEALVTNIINNLNGHHVVITADHGFIFTVTDPGAPEKSSLLEKPLGTVKAKKRYLIGKNLGDNEIVYHESTTTTCGVGGNIEFWIPKAANRFHFIGGARFIHGGAMLQEIAVPVITVKHVRGKSAEKTKIKPVTVHILGSNHKITTSKHRFELIQMEPVSERVKPVTLKVAIFDEGEPVSNIETLTFDNSSNNIDERKKNVVMVLQNREFDKNKTYRLVMRDADTGIEQESVNIIIDRAFNDDF